MEYTRIAVIDKKKCQPKACNYLCYRVCPPVKMNIQAIEIANKESFTTPNINEELCTGCGICPNKCPFKAISIVNIGVKVGQPIHQYGKNSFRVYSLPLAEKESITGLIGINGSGKTTATNILSGNIVPNHGDYQKPGEIDEIIEFYRGKEIQKIFIDIKNKKLSYSYKIQKVEEIPKIFNKPIKELFEKINKDQSYFEKVIKELEIKDLLNKTPKEISGGELQRVAIAATLLKKANIYFFDEYTTFLDIKQRFKIAKILREKIDSENSILLIEHDLAILDYVSDFVQIMFGKKNAYGMTSNKKTTRKGINEFLEGFLKEENIKIRDKKIDFYSTKFEELKKQEQETIAYPQLKKKLGNFILEVNQGKLYKSEIVGVLGPNAIGKTTFIKMLAGELKPDNLELEKKIKVSYKPQYIDLENEKSVQELFKEKDINQEIYNTEIKRQLDIESISQQKLNQLSGGELQKVAVAYALSKDADVYLIDEPSAFLDVEQRLVVSNVIRNVIVKTEKSALVIDHDLLLVEYLSDRVLLFSGEPSKKGIANKIENVKQAFNKFLKEQDMTFRKDPDTKRPRANKLDSQKDREQRKAEMYYDV